MVNVRKSYISIRAFGWFTNTKPLMTGLNNEKPNFKKNLWFYNIVASSVSNETGAIETASKMYTHSISLFIVFVADVFFFARFFLFLCAWTFIFTHVFVYRREILHNFSATSNIRWTKFKHFFCMLCFHHNSQSQAKCTV